jgi:DNA-binding GntR family transcriptional regulator
VIDPNDLNKLQAERALVRAVDIRSKLIEDISSGSIGPGDRLTIDDFAKRYGASLMPVREALRELHGAGILRHGSGRSMRLAPLDCRAVENLFDARSVVEVMRMRPAAQRFTRRDAEALELIEADLERAVDADDDEAVLAANRRFRTAIYAVTDKTKPSPSSNGTGCSFGCCGRMSASGRIVTAASSTITITSCAHSPPTTSRRRPC